MPWTDRVRWSAAVIIIAAGLVSLLVNPIPPSLWISYALIGVAAGIAVSLGNLIIQGLGFAILLFGVNSMADWAAKNGMGAYISWWQDTLIAVTGLLLTYLAIHLARKRPSGNQA